jgi:flagellin
MSSNITLTSGVRDNLLALQNISQEETTTQERLATGKKVNSALDNPTEFFTASALTARAGELTNLLDSITNAINTLNAASNGLTSITTTIQSLQATATQALQDSSFQSTSFSIDTTAITSSGFQTIGFSGGAVGSTAVNVVLNNQETLTGASTGFSGAGGTLSSAGTVVITASDINSGNAVTVTLTTSDTASTAAAKINHATGTSIATTTPSGTNAELELLDPGAGNIITVSGTASAAAGFTTSLSSSSATTADTVDQLVNLINNNTKLSGFIKASDNAGQLQIQNLSTAALTVAGINASSEVDGSAGTSTIAGNSVRANLVNQFNLLRDQLNETANDSSFNGTNLLNGDSLKVFFNETSTSSLTIQSTNSQGINTNVLGIQQATDNEFQNNTDLQSRLQELSTALTTVATQASNFGSNLSIVENRQDFTNATINTLTNGANDLTAADTNLEGANLLALQTQQQLSITSLSLASQSQQAVLRLFG